MSSETTHHIISEEAGVWLLAQLSPQALFHTLTGPDFVPAAVFKGFKVTPKTLLNPVVQQRIAKAMSRHAELVWAVLRSAEAPWSAWGNVLDALEQSWVMACWRDLARHPEGGRLLLAAMALDERESVSRRGWRALRCHRLWLDTSSLRQGTTPAAWTALKHLLETAPAVPKADTEQATESLKRRNETLDRQNQELHQRLRTQKSHCRQNEELHREQQTKWQETEKTLRQTLRHKDDELQQTNETVSQQVREQVLAFKRQVLGLGEDAQQLRSCPDNQDLLAQVDAVLRAQKRLNEKHGLRAEIRERIEALDAARRKLRLAADESVVTLPDLQALQKQIRERIHQLRARLGDYVDDSDASDLADQLQARIKSAHLDDAGRETLIDVQGFLQQPLVADLLGSEIQADLADLVHTRLTLLDSLQKTPPLEHTCTPPGQVPGATPTQTPREIWDVAADLRQTPQARLYIDGYNLIRCTPILAELETTEGLAAARGRLITLCRARAGRCAHLELVFDGKGVLSQREHANGIVVVYAAALQESQNADIYLVRRLQATADDPRPAWLVSDDYGLRKDAERVCCAYISTADFYRFLTL